MNAVDISYETVEDMVIQPINSRFIEEYVDAVCSDWYNEYHIVKYDGRLDKGVIANRILEMSNRYVIAKWDGTLVGGIALSLDEEIFNGNIELSYFILPAFQNKGIATKIISHVCNVLTEHDNKEYISLIVDIMQENKSSIAVAEHCGFKEVYRKRYEDIDKVIIEMKYQR